MGNSCAIIPNVSKDKSTRKDSRLFKDLLSFTGNNRKLAVDLYLKTKNKDFIDHIQPHLDLDDNGEPTLKSLMEKTDFKNAVNILDLQKRLNKSIGYYKKGEDRPALWKQTSENYNRLMQDVIKFNTQSEYRDRFVARVIKIFDRESRREYYGKHIEIKNKEYSLEADRQEYNHKLNERLREILAGFGISVGVLDALEEREGISGVTDFNMAKTTADGLIELIRIAQGIKGEKALPEEFAHFALAALGEHPLAKRLVQFLIDHDLVREIIGEDYDLYYDKYDGSEYKLAVEAAGKLLAEHLLKSKPIEAKPYKNLLHRLINAIKDFFARMSMSDIMKAKLVADKKFSKLAENLLSGELENQMSLHNISESTAYYNLKDRVDRDKGILNRILDTEAKRMAIYEKRSKNSAFSDKQRDLMNKLRKSLIENNEIEGIYSYLENALTTLKTVEARLNSVLADPASGIAEKCRALRNIRNYMYSYKDILIDIRKGIIDEEKYEDNRYGEKVKILLKDTSYLLENLFLNYKDIAMPLFSRFIEPFMEGRIKAGKRRGEDINTETLLKQASEDITVFDRWLDSVADSRDDMLKVMDQIVKKSKESGRLRVLDIIKQIEAAGIKLEEAGIKNTDWMSERDKDGNLTGNYISEYNLDKWYSDKAAFLKSLAEKYGESPVGENILKYRIERKEWFDSHMEMVNGKKMPKKSIYGNKDFLTLTTAQKEYYDTFLKLKSELDSYLPEHYTSLLNTIKIRKDLLERLKSSKGKGMAKQIIESAKDSVIRRSDDIGLRDKATIMDFEGEKVQSLPIYFTRLSKGENQNDISTDSTSSLIAYAAMAIDFDEMNKVIDVLEIGRDIMKERKIVQTQGGKPLVEKIEKFNRKVENLLVKSGSGTMFMDRLNDLFDMQVYGRYMKDEGTVGKVDKAKAANLLNKLTALNTFALSTLAGISNVATGKVMMRIEAFSKEFFTEKNVLKADSIYGKAMPEFMSQIGSRVKTSKLYLWDELMNVLQDYEQSVHEINFDRKTWFSRMLSSNTLFFMSSAGEHWMQNRTSLALADAYKMKTPDGKIVSLWDAMEVVYIDPIHKNYGAKLQLKKGYTKADGTAFTKEDIIRFSRKSAAINQRMHGIYNKADKMALQKVGLGRIALMYRNWIRPSWNRRFKHMNYNYDLEAYVEGYYMTTGKFLWQLCKDLKKLQFTVASRYDELNDTEKANIRRALTEVIHFLTIALFLGMGNWSDDKKRTWSVRMLEYQAHRLYTEVGTMIPGPTMISEGFRILKSPAAGIQTAQGLINLIKLANPWNYMDEIEGGKYKGHSTAYKALLDSPIIPFRKTIYRSIHPEESLPFFAQQ